MSGVRRRWVISGVVNHVKHLVTHPLEPITHPKKFIKGEWNTAKKFVKKNWKKILIAAAIVFTAGIATVGVAGFAAASASAGGGFAGFMSAAGSTFAAGAASIGATVGIGSGASGAAAASGAAGAGAAGAGTVAAGTGATVGAATGATAAGAAGAAGAGVAGATTLAPVVATATVPALTAPALTVGDAALAAGGGLMAASAGSGAPTAQSAETPQKYSHIDNADLPQINVQSTQPTISPPTGSFEIGSTSVAPTTVPGDVSATPASDGGFFSNMSLGKIMNSKAAGPLIYGGMNAIRGAMQGQAIQDQLDQTKPLSYWGVGARGNANGGGAVSSPFGAGETLNNASGTGTTTSALPNGLQQGAIFNAGANVPNGNRWLPQAPNANQGLMATAWNVQTGKPYNPSDPNDPNNPYGYRYQ